MGWWWSRAILIRCWMRHPTRPRKNCCNSNARRNERKAAVASCVQCSYSPWAGPHDQILHCHRHHTRCMIRYRLAAAGGSLLLSIALIEVVLRMMNLGLGNSPIESDAYLHHVHPRSYQFVQQHPSGELGGFAITYDAERRVVRNTP